MNTVTGNAAANSTTLKSQVEGAFIHMRKLREERVGYETKAAHVTYRKIAEMVTIAERCDSDDDYNLAVTQYATQMGVPLPNEERGDNPWLHVARLGDGEEIPIYKRGNKVGVRWRPDRSMEKHSKVVRFCRTYDISGETLLEVLMGKRTELNDRDEEVVLKHFDLPGNVRVKATLADIMRHDGEVNGKEGRGGSTSDPKPPAEEKVMWGVNSDYTLDHLQPIQKVKLVSKFQRLIKPVYRGVTAVLVRVADDGSVELLGDAYLKEEALKRVIKDAIEEIRDDRLHALANYAAQLENAQYAEKSVAADHVREEAIDE